MNFSMTGWVEKHSVFRPVCAAHHSPHDMMVVPSRDFCDFLLADRTNSILLFPEMEKLPSSFQGGLHPYVLPTLEVDFPRWVVRVRFPFNLHMSLY
jgi:hypothetical protein